MLRRAERPVCALPLELFRVGVGSLGAGWFLRHALEARDFSLAGGLIDHRLSAELFWYTRFSLLPPATPDAVLLAVYGVGFIACVGLALGLAARACAALAFVLAVSSYRRGFLVMFVDDAVLHLTLFWCMLLPIGRVLRIPLRGSLRSAWREARESRAPGFVFRCVCANLSILYLTAGLWKLTSPLWRSGDALWVALHLPIAWQADLLSPDAHRWLRPIAWTAIAIEILYPLLHVLRPRSHAKSALALSVAGMHVGIAATMDIVTANLGCLAALVLCYPRELAAPTPDTARPVAAQRFAPWIAGTTVLLLVGAMLTGARQGSWREPGTTTVGVASHAIGASEGLHSQQKIFYTGLWMLGLAQQYQLFDWIDERRFTVRYTVIETDRAGRRTVRASTDFLPTGTRFSLLATYLHGVTWTAVPASRREELRASLGERLATRYCRRAPNAARVEVDGQPYEIDPFAPDGLREASLTPLSLRFSCPRTGES
jgi:hypothetical protein